MVTVSNLRKNTRFTAGREKSQEKKPAAARKKRHERIRVVGWRNKITVRETTSWAGGA
jgi:hypothetical protein